MGDAVKRRKRRRRRGVGLGLIRRVISDGGKRNGLLARKAPNTAPCKYSRARDAESRGRGVGGGLNFRYISNPHPRNGGCASRCESYQHQVARHRHIVFKGTAGDDGFAYLRRSAVDCRVGVNRSKFRAPAAYSGEQL